MTLLPTSVLIAVLSIGIGQAEPTELSWDEADQQLLMDGSWWTEYPPILPGADVPAPTMQITSKPGVNDVSPVDPLPENKGHMLNDDYLPDYIRTATGLIDPQRLLTEVEKEDIIALIRLVKEKYNINLFVSIFDKGQSVPPSVNAPSVARQVFRPNSRNLLIHYHIGDIKSIQIAPDKQLGDRLGDDGRRRLLYNVKEDASVYSDPQDELMAAILSLVNSTAATIKSEPVVELPAQHPNDPKSIPDASITIEQEESQGGSHLSAIIKGYMEQATQNIWSIVAGLGGLCALIILYSIRRRTRRVRLLPSTPDKRLSAPVGASQSRPVNYRGFDDKHPDHLSRAQIRHHMNEVS